MTDAINWLLFFIIMIGAPPLAIGCIRKLKAKLQNRIGAPIVQPWLDIIKMLRKGETVSHVASWVLRGNSVISLVSMVIVAMLLPWLSFRPAVAGADLFLVIYILAFMRFMTVLSSLDAGSPFGGFGGSREVTLALLVEPGVVLCLASLSSLSRTSDLTAVFAYSNAALQHQPGLWVMCGLGLFLTSIVELSRMPADDPTTHLELTMVHEAMTIEYSGRNLGLVEWTHALKLLVLFGLSGQCFLHALPTGLLTANFTLLGIASVVACLLPILFVALIEATQVKLRWTKVPEFIAYAVGVALICTFIAVGRI